MVLSRPSVFVEMADCELNKRVAEHAPKNWFGTHPQAFSAAFIPSSMAAITRLTRLNLLPTLQCFTESGYLEEHGAYKNASVLPGVLALSATGDPARCPLR